MGESTQSCSVSSWDLIVDSWVAKKGRLMNIRAASHSSSAPSLPGPGRAVNGGESLVGLNCPSLPASSGPGGKGAMARGELQQGRSWLGCGHRGGTPEGGVGEMKGEPHC